MNYGLLAPDEREQLSGTALTSGLLSALAGAAGSAGRPWGQVIANSLAGGLQGYQGTFDNALQSKLMQQRMLQQDQEFGLRNQELKMRMAEAQRQQEKQKKLDEWTASYGVNNAPITSSGGYSNAPQTGDAPNFNMVKNPDVVTPNGRFDEDAWIRSGVSAGAISPIDLINMRNKTEAPVVLSDGGMVVDSKTGKVIASNPKDSNEKQPDLVRQFMWAADNGYIDASDPKAFERFKQWGAMNPVALANLAIAQQQAGYNLPAPTSAPSNPSAPKTYSVTVDGKTYTFPDKKSLNNFKMSAGIK